MLKKLNLLDMAIVILVLAVCFGFVINGIDDITGKRRDTYVTVIGETEVLGSVAKGDTVFAADGSVFGSVTDIEPVLGTSDAKIVIKANSSSVLPKTGEASALRTAGVLLNGCVSGVGTEK